MVKEGDMNNNFISIDLVPQANKGSDSSPENSALLNNKRPPNGSLEHQKPMVKKQKLSEKDSSNIVLNLFDDEAKASPQSLSEESMESSKIQ